MEPQEEWDGWTKRGEKTVVATLSKLMIRFSRRGSARLVAYAFGGIGGAAHTLRILMAPSIDDAARRQAEEAACAVVRGVLRGLEHPVHEDGTPFEWTPLQ